MTCHSAVCTNMTAHSSSLRCSLISLDLYLYVGEDSGGMASAESGIGLDIAKSWEHAIRQALMPVTPKSSMQLGEKT